jgi:uncharacterized membrane protein YphA (DoxX/SURF4 family)
MLKGIKVVALALVVGFLFWPVALALLVLVVMAGYTVNTDDIGDRPL